MRLTSVHFPLESRSGSGGLIWGEWHAGWNGESPLRRCGEPLRPHLPPQHDNLDARFEDALPAGAESYTVSRAVQIAFDADGSATSNPAWGATILTGTYSETITGVHKNSLDVEGPFVLRRLSDLGELHTP